LGNPILIAVNVIARRNLEAYWRRHRETEPPLRAWLSAARTHDWTSMNDVLRTDSKASPITSERCVPRDEGPRACFDLCGGNYRLIVAFKFSARIAFIKFIGTHTQYDRVTAATVSDF
jgi:mRNA interferase HigB